MQSQVVRKPSSPYAKPSGMRALQPRLSIQMTVAPAKSWSTTSPETLSQSHPQKAAARFLTHRNAEITKVCCFSLLKQHDFIWLPRVLVVARRIFNLHCGTWDLILVPDQGQNLGPLHWERGILATGPLGKSRVCCSKPRSFGAIYYEALGNKYKDCRCKFEWPLCALGQIPTPQREHRPGVRGGQPGCPKGRQGAFPALGKGAQSHFLPNAFYLTPATGFQT